MPRLASVFAGPIPESKRSCGDLYEPADDDLFRIKPVSHKFLAIGELEARSGHFSARSLVRNLKQDFLNQSIGIDGNSVQREIHKCDLAFAIAAIPEGIKLSG